MVNFLKRDYSLVEVLGDISINNSGICGKKGDFMRCGCLEPWFISQRLLRFISELAGTI